MDPVHATIPGWRRILISSIDRLTLVDSTGLPCVGRYCQGWKEVFFVFVSGWSTGCNMRMRGCGVYAPVIDLADIYIYIYIYANTSVHTVCKYISRDLTHAT